MKGAVTNMKIDMKEFTGKCSCGREHKLVVQDMFLEIGAIKKLPQILKMDTYEKYKNFVMVCDENTYNAAGKQVENEILGILKIQLDSRGLHANEIGVAKVKEKLDKLKEVDCLVAVGSGTIHDLTRYCAYERGIPFVSIPTAASVDGYVSTVAAMSWYGFKKSMIAVSPILVVADSQVIADAPMRLTASGVGDLLGKYTALADWKITNILNGEYICNRICDMEYEALNKLKDSLDGIKNGNVDAYEELMYGLLLSGLAMQMTGHSRPASGAEHHMAHFWEMAVMNNELEAYHGEKVGVGLILVSDIYHKAAQRMKSGVFKIHRKVDVEMEFIEKVFTNKELCENIKKTNEPNLLDMIDSDVLRNKTDEIIQIIEDIPTPEEIIQMLKKVEGVSSLKEIDLDDSMKEKSAKAAPYIRDRITFLRILKFYNFYDTIIK
jgi:glycerol-1-phosphate dehydrogenase [NAD(P)+]